MVRSMGLNHINLNVSNLARSERFYRDAFGLEVRFREGDDMVFVGSPGAHDLITLCQAKPGEAIGNGGVSHFGFRAQPSEFDAMVAQVERAGGTLLRRGHHSASVPFAYFSDSDGYTIELGV
ncbi:MAG TPA: VOC family protein [Rhizomicrobium sp.]|nr:VOC family protein [Rhizomicrobium sp.]